MLNLQKRINGVDEDKAYLGTRISIRDKLLAQGLSIFSASLLLFSSFTFINYRELEEI